MWGGVVGWVGWGGMPSHFRVQPHYSVHVVLGLKLWQFVSLGNQGSYWRTLPSAYTDPWCTNLLFFIRHSYPKLHGQILCNYYQTKSFTFHLGSFPRTQLFSHQLKKIRFYGSTVRMPLWINSWLILKMYFGLETSLFEEAKLQHCRKLTIYEMPFVCCLGQKLSQPSPHTKK